MRPNPTAVKHPPIDFIAHLQPPPLALHHPRQLQVRLHHRLLLIRHRRTTPPHLAIGLQHCPRLRCPPRQHIPHKQQIRFLLPRRPQEHPLHQPLHLRLRPGRSPHQRHLLTEALGQIGMAPRPGQHPPHHPFPLLRRQPQPRHQRHRLRQREILEINPVANIERRAARIPNQITGGRHPNQHKRKPMECRDLGTGGIEIANRREKVIGEVQGQRGVDFIHKHHQRLRHLHQQHLLKKHRQSLGHPQMAVILPPRHHVRLQQKLILQLDQHPQIPLIRRQLRSQILQIYNRRPHPLLLEHLGRVDHQTRLAHLPRR